MSSARPSDMSIDIASCAPRETIVVKTGSSVYELVVLEDGLGRVLVRGGNHFTTFCAVLFLGSPRPRGPIERHIIEIGLRMQFCSEHTVIVTSAVESIARHPATAPTACVACTPSEHEPTS